MRKIITLSILFLLLSFLPISIFAESSNTTCIKDEKIAELLTSSISEEELEILSDKSIYDVRVQDVDITDKPILKVFNEHIMSIAHLPLDDIINTVSEKAEKERISIDYVVFGEEPVRLRRADRTSTEDPDDYVILLSSSLQETPYITDIINMNSETKILNVSCKVESITVFDKLFFHKGALLYAQTNKGIFVKYYADRVSEGIWFAEEDFQKYSKAYIEHLIATAYDEEGNPLNGTSISLLDFIETKYDGEAAVSNNDKKDFSYLWIAIPVGVVGILSVVAVVIFRKKRLNKEFKYL